MISSFCPRTSPIALAAWIVTSITLVLPIAAQEHPHGPRPAASETASSEPSSKPHDEKPLVATEDKVFVTDHSIVLNGKPFDYRASAGTLVLKDEAGTPRGSFFFVAYTARNPDADPAKRPITFVFNGGPGAAAVWLHLGCIGPERLPFNDQGELAATPGGLVDNQQTWLDLTDLVFIDPVGTGYSRAAPGVKPEEFWGFEQDISSVAAFIRLYTTRYERWLSPKFLAGESYGTTRAAGLSEYLLGHDGIALNGIVFISTVLDFQNLEFSRTNDLPCVLDLPSYAAVAWYHKKLAPDLQADLQKTLAEVQAWTMSEYVVALAAGDQLKPAQRDAVAQRLSRYTSLSPDFIRKSNLRISDDVFRKMLLADQNKIIGRFDARLTADDPRPASTQWADFDPGLATLIAAHTAGFCDYARRTLKYDTDLPYEVLTGKVQPSWSFDRGGHGYLDVAGTLASAMRGNPHMKLMFASGYFDLATPYLGTEYTLDHMNLPPDLRANIKRTFYAGGHMVYHPKAGREKLKADVTEFMHWAVDDAANAPSSQPAK